MKNSIILAGLLLVASAAAGVAAFVAAPEHADAAELKPIQAQRLDIGALAGVAYYTVEKDGYRVVATLADGEDGHPMQIVGTLAPGQKLSISVPRAAGTRPLAAEISRDGDRVFISGAPLTQ